MRSAMVLTVDDDVNMVALGDTVASEYEVISGAVGGFVQAVPLADSGMVLWVHEEGKLIGLPRNGFATRVWERFWGATDWVAGVAVITGDFDDVTEKTLGLTIEQGQAILDLWEG